MPCCRSLEQQLGCEWRSRLCACVLRIIGLVLVLRLSARLQGKNINQIKMNEMNEMNEKAIKRKRGGIDEIDEIDVIEVIEE